MNINNPNDLYQFLLNNALSGVSPEAQGFVSCMNILLKMCSCDPAQAKIARYNQCTQNYIAFVSKSPSISGILLSKANDSRISFYLNGQLLSSIIR